MAKSRCESTSAITTRHSLDPAGSRFITNVRRDNTEAIDRWKRCVAHFSTSGYKHLDFREMAYNLKGEHIPDYIAVVLMTNHYTAEHVWEQWDYLVAQDHPESVLKPKSNPKRRKIFIGNFPISLEPVYKKSIDAFPELTFSIEYEHRPKMGNRPNTQYHSLWVITSVMPVGPQLTKFWEHHKSLMRSQLTSTAST